MTCESRHGVVKAVFLDAGNKLLALAINLGGPGLTGDDGDVALGLAGGQLLIGGGKKRQIVGRSHKVIEHFTQCGQADHAPLRFPLHIQPDRFQQPVGHIPQQNRPGHQDDSPSRSKAMGRYKCSGLGMA